MKVTHRRTISLGLNFIDTLLTTLDINRRPPIICRRMSWRQLSAHVLMKENSAQRAGTDPGSSVSQRLYLSSRQTNSPEYALGYSRQSSSRPPLLPSIFSRIKRTVGLPVFNDRLSSPQSYAQQLISSGFRISLIDVDGSGIRDEHCIFSHSKGRFSICRYLPSRY